jgi:hypothetical protein
MAACSVTTGGTNGTFRLDFDLGADHNVLYSTFGDVIWIDDTATNVTYTTLTGDVTATSGCVTITALPQICYLLEFDRWSGDPADIVYTSTFDAVLLDSTVYPFTTAVDDTIMASGSIVSEINNEVAIDEVKIVAAKSANVDTNYMTISFIIRVLGSEIPSLRLISPYSNVSYIQGTVSASCLPSGFVEIPIDETPAP